MIFRELRRPAQMSILWWNVWMTGDPFSLLFQTQNVIRITYYDTILETLSMSEKALRLLLNIFGNVNAASRLV